jgi:hypothetical protein
MARWHCLLAALLALAALSSGCATNRLANPFASTSSKSSTAQLAKKSAKNSSTTAGDNNSSRNMSAELAAAKASKSSGTDADESSASGDSALAKAAKDGAHDPETMAYINQQLRDASPDERTTLLAELKGMHPEQVRQILRGRRMAINHMRQQELVSQQSLGTTRPGAIQQTAGEPPTRTGPGSPVDASQNASLATARNGLPIGHSSGYRADGQPQNPAETAGAGSPPGIAAAGQANVSVAELSAVSPQVANQATIAAGPQRNLRVKPASVSIGLPMNAGIGPTTAMTPTTMPIEGAAREQLARLISAVEAEAVAMPPGETETEKLAFIKKQVDLRNLYLMSGQQERALQAIPGLDPADQEFWQQFFWGQTNYFDVSSIPSSTERAAQTVTQLTNAVLRLQEKANLELRNVTFCQRISNFGNFEKYPREEFSPGQEVLLYAEVGNIHSEPIPDGKFRTSLKSTIEIFRHGSQGELIERVDLPETVDVCRTHRRDYFHSYQYTMPTKLTLGPHLLKLTLEDQLSHRVATYTLNFMVK